MDFEAELAKFQPSLDIEQAEDAIYGNSTTDVTDLVQSIERLHLFVRQKMQFMEIIQRMLRICCRRS